MKPLRKTPGFVATAVVVLAVVPASICSPAYARHAVTAAKQKTCSKKGSRKKCTCPAHSRRVKKHGRYRCVKPNAPGAQPQSQTTASTPDASGVDGLSPEAIAQGIAVLTQRLGGLQLTDSDENFFTGLGHNYVYTFCRDGTFRYSAQVDGNPTGSGSGRWTPTLAETSPDGMNVAGDVRLDYSQSQGTIDPGPVTITLQGVPISVAILGHSHTDGTEVQFANAGC